jgi:NADPH:quinone reductase-like Zn-dependent oxidoreductase
MSDGTGEVITVGDDVDEFKVADTVVSTFYPYWLGANRWVLTGGTGFTIMYLHGYT